MNDRQFPYIVTVVSLQKGLGEALGGLGTQ